MDGLRYLRLEPDGPLPDISTLAPFKTIVVLDAAYASDWQNDVSDWLVTSGCRYMMAWGPDCSSWDDSVDFADGQARNYEDDDSKFVMTTWHSHETLENVFWYAQFCAIFSFDDVELFNTIILHIGARDRQSEFLSLFSQARDLAEREAD